MIRNEPQTDMKGNPIPDEDLTIANMEMVVAENGIGKPVSGKPYISEGTYPKTLIDIYITTFFIN